MGGRGPTRPQKRQSDMPSSRFPYSTRFLSLSSSYYTVTGSGAGYGSGVAILWGEQLFLVSYSGRVVIIRVPLSEEVGRRGEVEVQERGY